MLWLTSDDVIHKCIVGFLTVPEAVIALGISKEQSKTSEIESMLRAPNCPFVLYAGTIKLVKRKALEEFISKKLII